MGNPNNRGSVSPSWADEHMKKGIALGVYDAPKSSTTALAKPKAARKTQAPSEDGSQREVPQAPTLGPTEQLSKDTASERTTAAQAASKQRAPGKAKSASSRGSTAPNQQSGARAKHSRGSRRPQGKPKQPCGTCGAYGHREDDCRMCHKCGKYGHRSIDCRTSWCSQCLKWHFHPLCKKPAYDPSKYKLEPIPLEQQLANVQYALATATSTREREMWQESIREILDKQREQQRRADNEDRRSHRERSRSRSPRRERSERGQQRFRSPHRGCSEGRHDRHNDREDSRPRGRHERR